jgi:ankyrin repeat protein
VNHVNEKGSTALCAAAMRGFVDVVKLLVAHRADFNQETHVGDSALSLAVWKNETDVVLYLLELGASTLRVDQFGDTMLLDASKHGNVAVMRRLLERGLAVNHQNLKGVSALHRAAAAGERDAVELLLEAKADPNLRDAQGDTPLHVAVRADERGAVEALLRGGADSRIANAVGVTPLGLAEDMEVEAVRAPWGRGARGARRALTASRLQLVEMLRAAALAAMTPEERRGEELLRAAAAGDAAAVAAALDAGVAVDHASRAGATALHLAADALAMVRPPPRAAQPRAPALTRHRRRSLLCCSRAAPTSTRATRSLRRRLSQRPRRMAATRPPWAPPCRRFWRQAPTLRWRASTARRRSTARWCTGASKSRRCCWRAALRPLRATATATRRCTSLRA